MADRRLEQRHELVLVAGEAARHEGCPEEHRHRGEVDRLIGVADAALRRRTGIGGRRELPLGQAVDPVVLDDVDHVDAAPEAVGELAEADRGGIAVAGDPDIDEVAVGEAGAGRHRRHAAVDAVEAVALAEEIGRRLRRAADPRQLRHPVRRQVELEAGLDQRRRDRIVPAPGAERRHRALVVAVGEAELVGRQLRVMEPRLEEVGHSAASLCALPASTRHCWVIASMMKRAVIGVPS